ncbi:peptidylprolyl isomerase [Nitratireductor alexandrii]|uniref:peptidylprolyl isomerase n=1 Tax=Nitratireductor alexandrii TaxID=2448161 RepID=UPI000FD8431B|nr:peptidylprolyl isomerase [Nitratireductor alexandrii]
MSASAPTRVEVETELGSFTLAVDEANAPISAGNFLAYVDGGHLDGSAVYRIVTMHNQPPETPHKIEVIQWGWRLTNGTEPPFPPIPHEPTSQTGLRHLDGTLSMARRAPGTAGPGFFICRGDQPELDEGGGRNPDRAGFAAFGQLVSGRQTIESLFARATSKEYLETPIRIVRVARMASPDAAR